MDDISDLTGLQLLQAMLDGKLPWPSMARTIPMQGVGCEEGFVKFTAVASNHHLNPMGGVHGGFAATVLDAVTGCAVHTTLGPGDSYGTVDLNIKMVRPVPVDETTYAEGRVINVSKTVGIAEGSLLTDNGKLLAHATCTCAIRRFNKG